MRDRNDTPTVAHAVACGILILLVQFFMNFAMPREQNLAVMVAVSQLVVIATPALLMTVMLTRSYVKTLRLTLPPVASLAAVVVLAVCVHPLAKIMQATVLYLYPLSDGVKSEIGKMFTDASLPVMLLLLAIVPAVCEELAFRGFILSGMRHMGHKWRAIVVSSIFFGLAHGVFQQSLVASVLGMLLGYVAIQTGSIFPGMLFHMLHNGLQILSTKLTPRLVEGVPLLEWLIDTTALTREDDLAAAQVYRWPVVVLAALGACLVLYWLHRLPYARSQEELLQESIERRDAPDVELSTVASSAGS
jgi:sodium transport system permease protein